MRVRSPGTFSALVSPGSVGSYYFDLHMNLSLVSNQQSSINVDRCIDIFRLGSDSRFLAPADLRTGDADEPQGILR